MHTLSCTEHDVYILQQYGLPQVRDKGQGRLTSFGASLRLSLTNSLMIVCLSARTLSRAALRLESVLNQVGSFSATSSFM